MTHEIRAGRQSHDTAGIGGLPDHNRYDPADALRASPVLAPYEQTIDGVRSAQAEEYDSGQLMVALLQAEEYAEVFGR